MNNVLIFYGSKSEFQKYLPEQYNNLTELVHERDKDKRTHYLAGHEPEEEIIENLVAEADEYAGVNEHVVLNFGNYISQIEVNNLYLHNPPVQISSQVERLYKQCQTIHQEYQPLTRTDLINFDNAFHDEIIGQQAACGELLLALFPLTSGISRKPVVILLYGDTGIGKTESVQLLSRVTGQNVLRKQFSMYQNNEFANYLFGGTHSEKSFSKDILARESNIILLDEFDKANSIFHSAFYQLFDEGIYEDMNYSIDVKNAIIVCTSNYRNPNEIRQNLGAAILSRFDSVIKYDDLNVASKITITKKSFEKLLAEYDGEDKKVIESEMDYEKLVGLCIQCTNAREISNLIRNCMAAILLTNYRNTLSNEDPMEEADNQ